MSATNRAPESRSPERPPTPGSVPSDPLEGLFERAAVPLRVIGADGTILHANRAELDLFGRAAGDYVGHNIADFHVDRSGCERMLARLACGEALRNHPTRMFSADGAVRHVLVTAEPRLRDGALVDAHCLTVDVSERQELHERLMLAQEAGGVGTFERDMQGDTIQGSPTFWRLFGVEKDGFPRTYRGWLSRVYADDRDRVREELERSYRSGRYEIEYRVLWPNGELRWLHSRGLVETGTGGKPVRMRGAVVDVTDRKAAENALRHQEDELRRVTDAIPALVSYVDARQRFRLANRAYVEWFGRPREAVEGRHVREVLGEAMYETVRPAVEKALRGEATRFEGRRTMPDGREREVVASYVPRFGRHGRVIGFYAFVNDITERTRTVNQLRAHTALLATVLETVPAAVWVSEDPEGRRISGSRYAAQLFRKAPGDNLSRTPGESPAPPSPWHYHKDGVELPLDASPLRRALRGEVVRAEELDLVYTDGDRLTLLMSAAPLFDTEGRLSGAVGAGMDISDRVRTEAALRARTVELEAIMSTVPAAIWLSRGFGPDQVEASRYTADLLRIEPGSRQFRSMLEGTPPDHFRVLKDGREVTWDDLPLHRAERGEDVREEELELCFDDGDRIPILINASPLRDQAGRTVGSVGAGIDISERKRAEERQHLLTAELDHRVKNMLSTVMAIVARTASGHRSADDIVQTLNGRIMAMARAHDRLAASSWEGVSLRALIDDELRPYADAERARYAGPDVMLSAKGATALALVLHELATNAAKYGALSTESGRISVAWKFAGSEAGQPERILRLDWREAGGPTVAEPRSRGFGSTLIERTLAFEFDAHVRLDWDPTGLSASFSLPLTKVASGRRAHTVGNAAN